MPLLTKQLIASLLVIVIACLGCDRCLGQSADAIFVGGDIITVNDVSPSAEAIAIRDGKIVAVGDRDAVMQTRGPETKIVDLDGQTMLPGFIDGHSHFINALSVANQANVYPPPFGPGDSVDAIVSAVKTLQAEQQFSPGELIMAYGYDDNALPADRKLTAADLDAAFADNPVIVQHVSLHGAVLNSAALKKYAITAETATPPGGIILRKPGTNEPEGLLMETAYLPIFESLEKPKGEALIQAIQRGQQIYAEAGITTSHEGSSTALDVQILNRAATNGELYIDVIAFPFITELDRVLTSFLANQFGKYNQRFKLGGVKITIDGSPQGKTAEFTTPYLTGGPGGEPRWRGEPTFPIETFDGMVKKVYDAGLPLIVHCNGDAAIDHLLAAHEKALGDKKSDDHRTGIIHCQFVRKDQLDKIAEYKLFPSFYTEHTYFFAATHIQNRGLEQASFLSPLKSSLDRGIRFANHTDFNVAPIDQMFVIWSAVNRMSREGEVLDPEQRISAIEAIKAVTIHPAYWCREKDRKGSLEVGKLADFVILDKNPQKVDPIAIKDIRVIKTIKEGVTVFALPNPRRPE
ncbi:N-substituted formamide deformylase precursor [Rubripirellula tenax]|uniref:N-substituted formamide deformylase n=1 Tax=Rubripirellula tenax TaxID=2528015 RepID=A0A5C6FAY0_9BACT|nr:amidohydrolase [Rubripirellula tenax]TWU58565.1 N-substituted formamide deformylase precursor [Rubripirellula tenax]